MKGHIISLPPDKYRFRTGAIIILGIICLVGIHFVPPVPQDQEYYNFADQRVSFSIPFFGDVITNLAYLVPALCGLFWLVGKNGGRKPDRFFNPLEVIAYYIFFGGILLTALGSTWFHLEPNNDTLLWDRLPMTFGFMGLLSVVIAERVSVRYGIILLPVLVILGIASVCYWYLGETRGAGDLRYYGLVQYYPVVAIPLMVLIFPPIYSHSGYMWATCGCYGFAKLVEVLDHQIFSITGNIVSGHNLKHIIAAASSMFIYLMVKQRHRLQSEIDR